MVAVGKPSHFSSQPEEQGEFASGSGGARTGSGTLVEPSPPPSSQARKQRGWRRPRPQTRPPARSLYQARPDEDKDEDEDEDDLAPTEPQMPSIPRLRVQPPIQPPIQPPTPPTRGGSFSGPPPRPLTPRLLNVAADFSEFILWQEWMHDEALDPLPVERRMQLFSHMLRVYLPVLQAAGRMETVKTLISGRLG